MDKILTTFLIMLALLLPTSLLAAEAKCDDKTPCLTKVLVANVRVYNDNLEQVKKYKKGQFSKMIKTGLTTKGWHEIKGIRLLKISDPDQPSSDVFVEGTAFELSPSRQVICSDLASASLGLQQDSTKGVSVGLGESCVKGDNK